MNRIFTAATYIFDPIHHFWERDRTQRAVAGLLVIVFLLSLGVIELKRQGFFPDLLHSVPTSHFFAVNVAFTLVLILEVVSFIFVVPCSLSKAVGKQFEILALILLRNSFKKLIELPEPIDISGHADTLIAIGVDGLGAVAIFALLGVFRLLIKQDVAMRKGETLFRYVAVKKIVALVLLASFMFMGAQMLYHVITGQPTIDFFSAFYTALVFSDILLVLISQYFLPRFRAVFRNSGFALATLFIRLALTAPVYWDVALGVSAAVFAVLISVSYNGFYALKPGKKRMDDSLH